MSWRGGTRTLFSPACRAGALLYEHLSIKKHQGVLETPSEGLQSSFPAWSPVRSASRWNRTTDARIFSPPLYRLSYRGMLFPRQDSNPHRPV